MVYESATPVVQTGHNATIRLGINNEPQPDSALLIDPACGGQVRITSDNYVEGAPELVVEISASTVARDVDEKLHVYLQGGVREYLNWRVEERTIDWYDLQNGQFVTFRPDVKGIVKSVTFPGLWLDVPSMLRFDSGAVLRVLQQGLSSTEHSAFVRELESRRKSES
jgi:Uma2 family endonuclease